MRQRKTESAQIDQATLVENGASGESIFDNSRRIKRAFDYGVRDALIEHKRLGNSVVEWRDGAVVLVPAEEIDPNIAIGKKSGS